MASWKPSDKNDAQPEMFFLFLFFFKKGPPKMGQ
jgi:hypothetical protein